MEPALYTDDDRFRALLKRWMEGDVTAAEERELFRLARNDAFRQAALDGYLAFPEADHASVVRELHARIQRPAPPRFQIFPWWMAVAAAMALLLAGWWFWPRADGPQQASAPVAAVEEKTMDAPEQIPDTAPLAMRSDHAAETRQPSPDPSPAAKKAQPGAPVPVQPDQPSGAADIATAEEALAAKPLPPADAAPARSAPMATQSPAGKAAELQKEKAAPEVWWQDLQRYLRTRARLTPEARNNNISGSVRLRGRLQPDGKLTDIIFEETLGYGLEKQALLLMQGFNWPIGKDTLLEVDVRFVR